MTLRQLAMAALIVQVGLAVWTVVFFVGFGELSGTGPDLYVSIALSTAGFTSLVAVGALLARRQQGHPLVLVLIVPFLLGTARKAIAGWVVVADLHGWPGIEIGLWLAGWLWLLEYVGLVVLLFRFPTGTAAGPGWRRYEFVVWVTFGLVILLAAFSPSTQGTPLDRPNPLGVPALAAADPYIDTIMYLLALHAAVGVACMVVRFIRGDEVERQQLRWIAAAGALLLVGIVIDTAFQIPWITEAVGVLLLPMAIAVAVLRYRLWDLGLLVRRTVLYVLLTGLLLGAYVGSVLLLRSFLPGMLPEILLTALVALVALPLRGLLQTALDRMLYGYRRDPYLVVRSLGRRLESSVEPLLPMAARELAQALRLPYLAIVLPGEVEAAVYGTRPAEGLERLPLQHSGVRVGELAVARRHPAEPLTALDRRFLTGLAGHLGVAVRAAALDEELRSSHRRLLAIREEERNRIQHDLHDELGPLLGAASLRVQAASNLLAGDDTRLREVTDAIGADLVRALGAVQRILTDLQPEPLDRQGLLAALRQRVDSWAGRLTVEMDLPSMLPPLSAQVEAAVYRIAIEALHNAARHSDGSRATLRVRVIDESLEVEVTDDGIGLPTPLEAGVGMRSMRERAERLGGSLTVVSGVGGGARVHGILPAVTG